jgi:hypothetical protein
VGADTEADRFAYPALIPDGRNQNIEKTAAIQIQFFGVDRIRPSSMATLLLTFGGPSGLKRETFFLINRNQDRLMIERDCAKSNASVPDVTYQRNVKGARIINKSHSRMQEPETKRRPETS